MAIVNTAIKAQISALIKKTSTNSDTAKAEEDFAQGLADIIETAIKSSTVTTTVTTVVTGAAGPFPVVATGSGAGTGILT